jgi:hypothetical protein
MGKKQPSTRDQFTAELQNVAKALGHMEGVEKMLEVMGEPNENWGREMILKHQEALSRKEEYRRVIRKTVKNLYHRRDAI